jgi:inosine-uridine nucleoside N-ribohydrolase
VTNLAHALQTDKDTFSRVKNVIWMGGALDHPGNTSPVAEFNCYADPYAAHMMLEAVKSGLFTMVLAPLDITTPHQIPFDDLIHSSYPADPDPSLSPLKHLTSAMLGRVRGLQASFGLPDAMEMHDPVAVWYAIAHAHLPDGQQEEGWKVKARQFKVERNGELTRGMCVIDRRGGGDSEGSGETRTQDKELADNHIPEAGGKKDRDGSEITQSKNEALIMVDTPGSEVLRKILLERVFGTKA